MNKYQTQFVKGLALLFMIWGHLFSNPEVTGTLLSSIKIDGIPFSSIICRGMGPVDFFFSSWWLRIILCIQEWG